jgi:hypothetical protein
VKRSVVLVATLGLSLTVAGGRARAQCGAPLEAQIVESLRARQFLDAHVLARTALALCPAASPRYRTYDGLALIELDDIARAREAFRLAATGGDADERRRAQVLHAWTFARERDETAFAHALGQLPPGPRLRLQVLDRAGQRSVLPSLEGLEPGTRDPARAAIERLWTAERTRRPWLAASLSAVLPGAGQAYAGSWQGAAVAFVLNGVLIGACAELAVHKLYLSAGAAGVAASFFYVGNVINAADLARRRNEMAAAPARLELARRLLPEAHP